MLRKNLLLLLPLVVTVFGQTDRGIEYYGSSNVRNQSPPYPPSNYRQPLPGRPIVRPGAPTVTLAPVASPIANPAPAPSAPTYQGSPPYLRPTLRPLPIRPVVLPTQPPVFAAPQPPVFVEPQPPVVAAPQPPVDIQPAEPVESSSHEDVSTQTEDIVIEPVEQPELPVSAPEPVTVLVPVSEPEPIPEPEPVWEPELVSASEPIPVLEPISQPEPASASEPVPVLEPFAEPKPVSESEPILVLEPEPVSEAEPVMVLEPEPVSASEPVPEPALDVPVPVAEPIGEPVSPLGSEIPSSDIPLRPINARPTLVLENSTPHPLALPPLLPKRVPDRVPVFTRYPIPLSPTTPQTYLPPKQVTKAPPQYPTMPPKPITVAPPKQYPTVPPKPITVVPPQYPTAPPKPITVVPPQYPTAPPKPITVAPPKQVPTQSPPVRTTPSAIFKSDQCKKGNGFYPVQHECDSYIECKQGKAMKLLCPDGLHFNPAAKYYEFPCTFPSEVKCVPGAIDRNPIPSGQCPRQYGFYAMNDGDCSKFMICQEGLATIMDCPMGLAFNPQTSICDWPVNVPQCNPNVFKDFTCPAPPLDENGQVSDIIFNYRFGAQCKLYVACQRGRPRLLSCERGMAFDERTQSCIDEDYVKDCLVATPYSS